MLVASEEYDVAGIPHPSDAVEPINAKFAETLGELVRKIERTKSGRPDPLATGHLALNLDACPACAFP